MDLLTRVLASMIRRVITGASVSMLAVLVAQGFLGADLRDEILAWLNGPATAWIVTLLLTAGGTGLTWIDKYITRVKERVAERMITDKAMETPHLMSIPAAEDSIVEQAKEEVPAVLRPLVRAA